MIINADVSLFEARDFIDEDIFNKDVKALEYLLADEAGRWFLMRLCERCHILSSTYPDEGNVNQMLVFEGERRVALNVLANINLLGENAVEAKQRAEREYSSILNYHAQLLRQAEENEKEV